MAGPRKPVIPSRQAMRDIEEAIDWYLAEVGVDTASGFANGLAAALQAIGRQPGIGSPRYAHRLGVPDLRSWAVKGYPFLMFYMEHDDAVDVSRVLHGARDIRATLIEPEPPDE